MARGSGTCRECSRERARASREANREKARWYSREWYARNREQAAAASAKWERRNRARRTEAQRVRRANGEKFERDLIQRYGITAAEYGRLLAAQGGACACCGAASANRSGQRLFVDHDHETLAVRGLLCLNCNSGIGALGDTADGVRRALAYLDRPKPA